MKPPFSIGQLRRDARRLSKNEAIPLHLAQNRIAGQHGFQNWSLLAAHHLRSATAASSPQSTSGAHANGRLPGLAGSIAAASLPPPAASHPPTPPGRLDPRRRYYLHGDQLEEDPTRYYCARCDVFFEKEHFADHGPHTGERLLDQLEHWDSRDARWHMDWRRPDNASNCLQADALAQRAQYHLLRPLFSDWLLKRRKTPDRIGIMASNIITPRGLPIRPKSLSQLRRHFERYGKGTYHGLGELEAAWDEFLKLHRSPAT